jgi:uncharacterized protein YuzE
MRSIRSIRSEGPQGPVYIAFSDVVVADTEPIEENDEVVVDYGPDGELVGVELVSVSSETLEGLLQIARIHDLDLGALFARSIPSKHAA